MVAQVALQAAALHAAATDCFENAVAESFFATLKKELVCRRSWPNRRDLQSAVFDYIESFYNRERGTPRSPISLRGSTR